MLPDSLRARTLYDPVTGGIKTIETLCLITDCTGVKYRCSQWYDAYNQYKNLTGSVFIYNNAAYKIMSMDMLCEDEYREEFYMSGRILVTPYVDERLANLLSHVNDVRAHLFVCADSVEDLGYLVLAEELRARANKVVLENLIAGDKI